VVTAAPTEANRANLAPSFLAEVRAKFGGSRMGRQELDGVLVEDLDGAFWTSAALDAGRLATVPELDRIVVGVDPAVSSGDRADTCGIVVAGAVTRGEPRDWFAVVLEDASVRAASPLEWGEAVVAAVARHGASRVVAEVNQGGELVAQLIGQIDPMLPCRAVRATKGKAARAEPVAALYEQGRVRHVRGLPELEDQMVRMTRTGYQGSGSPDRVDAMVWAITDLLLDPATRQARPGIRSL
jgi:phage terminase large subunit-like protein